MADKEDWGPEGLDELEQELESLSSVSPDNKEAETLDGLDNEQELEEYGVWVKVGPETIHDSGDIDLEDTLDPELENLEEDLVDREQSGGDESELMSDLALDDSVENPEHEDFNLAGSRQAGTKERIMEPVEDLEESLSENIDWDKQNEQDEDGLDLSDVADSTAKDFDELGNLNLEESFDEIELGDTSSLDEGGSASNESGKQAAGSFRDEPEITSPGKLGLGQRPAGASSDKVAGAAGMSILEQIEKELSAIKNELAGLKKELSLIREGGHDAAEIEVKPVVQENSKGFFDEDDDEVVALTGDELDNILETADIMEEDAKDGENSPDAAAVVDENPAVSLSMEEDLTAPAGTPVSDISADAIEKTSDDELSLQVKAESDEQNLPLEGEEEVLSLEVSDFDFDELGSESQQTPADESVVVLSNDDEISLDEAVDSEESLAGAEGGKEPEEIDLQADISEEESSAGPAESEAGKAAETEEISELIDSEEEVTATDQMETEPEEVALLLPEEASIEDEEIVLDFPEELEDGLADNITEDFVEDEGGEAAEQEIALGSLSEPAEKKPSPEDKAPVEEDDLALDSGELEVEEEEIPPASEEFADIGGEPGLVDELARHRGAEEAADESAEQAGEGLNEAEDLPELEEELDIAEEAFDKAELGTTEEAFDTAELEEVELALPEDDTEKAAEDLSMAGDDLDGLNLDFPEDDEPEGNGKAGEEELEELDLETHEDMLTDEPEDLTLDIVEDEDINEPEEISLDLPDDLEVEEELPGAVASEMAIEAIDDAPAGLAAEAVPFDLTDEEQPESEGDEAEEITLTMADEEDIAPAATDNVELAEDNVELATEDNIELTDEAGTELTGQDIRLEDASGEELEEITLELPDEKTGNEEAEEIELEPVESDIPDVQTDALPQTELAAELQAAGDMDEPLSSDEPELIKAAGKPAAASGRREADKLPKDLKEEIKTVLTYMDQLLESLPEEKIEEFAKSEYFETYKKLFEDLGIVN